MARRATDPKEVAKKRNRKPRLHLAKPATTSERLTSHLTWLRAQGEAVEHAKIVALVAGDELSHWMQKQCQ